MPFKSEKQRKWMWANNPEMAAKWEAEEAVEEAAKRDYKAEYKKYGSSDKAKKYRAELNAYNRKKGTYGNGDKKDASHKGGKIVGFEAESKNRGRAEKSRLKKEQKFGIYESDLKRIVKEEHQKLKEGKLTESYKDSKWEVYVKDEKGNEKVVKVAKSKRAATILYNKIIKSDDYWEVGMRVIKEGIGEGKLTEAKQGYVVADIYGGLYTKKAVSEKKALSMLNKMSKWGGDKIFMIGVEAWNKPHKLNKKKKMVEEGKLIEGVFGKFDTGINFRGNGLTVYDRNQSKGGDFKSIAFIANGKVKLYDKDVKKEPKLMKALQNIAKSQLQVEGKLTEDWESTPGYSSKEAKNIVDGALRNYSKDLKKLQYRVIKDWMSKAKSGVIDYFDLVRGFKTGDVSRAHPYEVKFLQSVLEKDKIIERFRKYFGGKKSRR